MNDEQGSGETRVVDFGTFGDGPLQVRISPSDLVPVARAEIAALRAVVEEVVGMLSGLHLAAAPADQLTREAVGLLVLAAARLQQIEGA